MLIISLRTLLAQPLLWMRLKSIVTHGRFDWVAFDESRPLPVSVPSMPLTLKVILVGNVNYWLIFRRWNQNFMPVQFYSEFEDTLQIVDAGSMTQWCQWVRQIATRKNLPLPATDARQVLIREGVRYTGEQETLPLDPQWITRQLKKWRLCAKATPVVANNYRSCWHKDSGEKVSG